MEWDDNSTLRRFSLCLKFVSSLATSGAIETVGGKCEDMHKKNFRGKQKRKETRSQTK
jgi:hypothetical protein